MWTALLLAAVAVFIAWLWYGSDDGEKKEAAAAAAAAQESPLPQKQEEAGAKESLQRSYECAISETKPTNLSRPQEPVGNQLALSGDHNAAKVAGEFPETELQVKQPTAPLMNYKEYLRSEASSYSRTAPELPQSQEAGMHGVSTSAEAAAPSNKHEEQCKEQLHPNSVDREEWKIVPEHLAWGDATRKSSADDASSKDPEQAKRVVAVSPMPKTVHVAFRVHYTTHSEAQLIAVTGDHECLGQWQHYVPLRCDKDGFWSDSVVIPVDTRVEWKFVLVESGKFRRWEECDNRTLVTEHEDRVVHKWWGYY